MGILKSAPRARGRGSNVGSGGMLSSVLHYMVARKVMGRFARVGGIPGVVLGAAASYRLNRFMGRRGR